MMSVGTLLIAIRFGYGVEQFVLIQRIIPLFIAALIAFGAGQVGLRALGN